MKMIKVLVQQAMMIWSGILFAIAIEGTVFHCMGYEFTLEWYTAFSIILSGIVGCFPSILLDFVMRQGGIKLALGLIAHCLSIYGIIMVIGALFKWYSNVEGVVYTSISYLAIYSLVWFGTIWFQKTDDKKINKALDSIRDEE